MILCFSEKVPKVTGLKSELEAVLSMMISCAGFYVLQGRAVLTSSIDHLQSKKPSPLDLSLLRLHVISVLVSGTKMKDFAPITLCVE